MRGRRAWAFAPAVVVAAALFAVSLPDRAAAATPDASCGRESSLKSLNDNNASVITFLNHTSITVQTLWLDFNGKRVFYRQVASGQQYDQQTWITHPWVVADLSGRCLTLHVSSSRHDYVTVVDDPLVPPTDAPTVAPTAVVATPSSQPTATHTPFPDGPGVFGGTPVDAPQDGFPVGAAAGVSAGVVVVGAAAALGTRAAGMWGTKAHPRSPDPTANAQSPSPAEDAPAGNVEPPDETSPLE